MNESYVAAQDIPAGAPVRVVGYEPPWMGRVRELEALADFLLARIAEDEGCARFAIVEPDGVRQAPPGSWSSPASGVVQTDDDLWTTGDGRTSAFVQRFDPARMLAECEAKRQIVAECRQWLDDGEGGEIVATTALLQLGTPYADHPDYREGWKP